MTSSLLAAAPWWRPGTGRVLVVRGGRPLVGTYPISGDKNAVLPLMVSALLTPHLLTLRNVPGNLDVAVLAALLQRLGCEMHWSARADGLAVTISPDRVRPGDIDRELVSRMRASVLLLGALLARCGEARLPLPGATPSACAASTSTSPACARWAPPSRSTAERSRRRRPTAFMAPISCCRRRRSARPRT
jgi:UDP-N-acetylglucosamine 1-carboxyvinyltransferase